MPHTDLASPLICSLLATSWMLYYSMLPCHKTHHSSSSLLLAPSLPLCFCLALAVEDVFLTSVSPSPLRKKRHASSFKLVRTQSLNSLKNECFNGIILVCIPPFFFFYVSLWTCEISKAAENFITLRFLLNSVKHRRYSIPNLAQEGTGLGRGWYNVHSHPSSTVHRELRLPLIREMYGGLA